MSGTWERVCHEDEIEDDRPLGRVVGHTGQDRDRVCVARRADGTVVAMLDRCPHRDFALSRGLVRRGQLICAGHFWRFDLDTGRRTDLPEQCATLYPTRVIDGWVEALVPAPSRKLSMRAWLLEQAHRA